MTVKTPEQVAIAQPGIALKTDNLLHQPSISLKLAFQLLDHAVHAYQTAYRLQKLKSILEIRIALTGDQCAVECLGLTGIPVSYGLPRFLSILTPSRPERNSRSLYMVTLETVSCRPHSSEMLFSQAEIMSSMVLHSSEQRRLSRVRYLNVAFLFVGISASVNVRFTNISRVPLKSTSWTPKHNIFFFKENKNLIFATSRKSSKNHNLSNDTRLPEPHSKRVRKSPQLRLPHRKEYA